MFYVLQFSKIKWEREPNVYHQLLKTYGQYGARTRDIRVISTTL